MVRLAAMANKRHEALLEKVAHRNGVDEFDVLSAKECGCLVCGSVYSARDINQWDKGDNGLHALCPDCGSSAIICDNEGIDLHSKEFKSLAYRFLIDYPDYVAESRRRYCVLFQDGALPRNEHTECNYVTYLDILSRSENDAFATLSLARHYARSGKFHDADLAQAITLYRHPSLRTSSNALYELGNCYAARGAQGDKRLAFESYSKSAALGSTKASIAIAFAYLFGDYVKRDEQFGFECLLQIFDEVYPTAIRDSFPLEEFGKMAYVLASCFYSGYGTKEDKDRALRYYLIAILCCETRAQKYPDDPAFLFEKDVADHLEELSPANAPEKAKNIVFDADTFIDSFWDQCDDISKKEISNIVYEDGNLYFDLDSDVSLIVIDQGNGKITAVNHMSWTFQNVKYEQGCDDLRFEEICFVGADEIRFIHHDSNDGERVVLSVFFPPVENK
ncbi:MAG: sel1 repeat family protein [Bacilli bacterium]|nr:sel1 repeat family protein [Bacilli bacterium]